MSIKYKNCPLIEVACALNFAPNPDWDLALPGRLFEKVHDHFPERKQVQGFEFSFQGSGETDQRPIEQLQFISNDKAEVTLVQENLLGVSRLAPYLGWEKFNPTVKTVFSAFHDLAPDALIARVGLKYVNRIDIPSPGILLEEYFEIYPYVGKKLPQEHGPFIVGIQFQPSAVSALRIELQPAISTENGHWTGFLTLDCFNSITGAVTFDNLYDWMESAHETSLEYFEGALTDKTRGLLERYDL